ncbi:MAG TPA: hypothetical protein VFA81_00255 [Burkholderiales bacterium]|nr:hypothetical protein [Burkholderiales bacterium]
MQHLDAAVMTYRRSTVGRSARLFASIPARQHARFTHLASSRGVSSSKLLALMVDGVLAKYLAADPNTTAAEHVEARDELPTKYTVRLRGGEAQRLEQRAQNRGMQPSSYAAHVLRAHLRKDPPLPHVEFAQIKRLVNELSGVRGLLIGLTRPCGAAAPFDAQVIDAMAKLLPALKSIRERGADDAGGKRPVMGDRR